MEGQGGEEEGGVGDWQWCLSCHRTRCCQQPTTTERPPTAAQQQNAMVVLVVKNPMESIVDR